MEAEIPPRKSLTSSLRGETSALSGTLGYVPMLRDFFAHLLNLAPGTADLGDCESLFNYLKNKKTISEKFLVRQFLAIQQALETQESKKMFTGSLNWEIWPTNRRKPRVIWRPSFVCRNLK